MKMIQQHLVDKGDSMKNSDQGFYIGKFIQALRVGNYKAFLTRLEALFADIPYELNDQTKRHYQVIFYLEFIAASRNISRWLVR